MGPAAGVFALLLSALAPRLLPAYEGTFHDVAAAQDRRLTRHPQDTWVFASAARTSGFRIDAATLPDRRTWWGATIGFSGIPTDRYTRWFYLRGSGDFARSDRGQRLERGYGTVEVFRLVRDGMLSLGVVSWNRDKALYTGTQLLATAGGYCSGGSAGAFLFTVCPTVLGYHFEHRPGDDYHGLFLAGLDLSAAMQIARHQRVSVETALLGHAVLSWPMIKQADGLVRVGVHLNNDYLPAWLGIQAGFRSREARSIDEPATAYTWIQLGGGLRF